MERKSNYELLRIILFLLIICHHCFVHGIGLAPFRLNEYPLQVNDYFWVAFLNALCIIGVNTFVIISGFWKIKFNLTKVFKLLAIIFIYVILFKTSYLLYSGQNCEALSSLLFISHCDYWFMQDYLLLLFFAPLINSFYENQPPKIYLTFTAILMVVSAYFGFYQDARVNTTGYTFFQFITLYGIGRVLSIHKVTCKKGISASVYLLATLATSLIMYYLYSKGEVDHAWQYTYYNNPLVMIASIAFFLFFGALDFTNKKINIVAKYSLGIYLFQSSTLIESLLYQKINHFYGINGLPMTLLLNIGIAVGCFIIAIPLYALISNGVDKAIVLIQNRTQKIS